MPTTIPSPAVHVQNGRRARPAPSIPSPPAVLAEVTRGTVVESRHVGHVAIVAPDGRLLHAFGDPDRLVLLRSAVKPFQVLPLVTTGAADRYGFTEREIAVSCASHNGEDLHVELVTSILDKIGLPPEAMKFGKRPPLDPKTCEALEEAGKDPLPQHHECSGEHAEKLALACHLGVDPETYMLPEGPVEQHALRAISLLSGVPEDEIAQAQDNCGVVTFGVPLRAAALMYARLVAPPDDLDPATREACLRISRAMMAHPELVSGTDEKEALDTVLMRQKPGRLLAKMGAEGVQALALSDSEIGPVGIIIKMEDGDSEERSRGPIAIALLRRLGLFSDVDAAAMGDHREEPVKNDKEQQIGLVRATIPAF
ncbi:MAG TPA: asparaginase [Rhodothermales bacterium]|nr:asparaginase [Rhodothermales bacterium]